MSEIRQAFDEICNLLGKLPGIVVTHCAPCTEGVRIEFVAQNASAIEPLQRIALGANVRLEPWLSDAGASQPVKGAIVAGTSPRDSIEFGEAQLLGIHLVWHLHRAGLLAATQANLLLQKWHGATVGA